MKAPEFPSKVVPMDRVEEGNLAVLHMFKVEDIQHLGQDNLLTAQRLADHGDLWGYWQTPESIAPSKIAPTIRNIDLASRIHVFLDKEPPMALPVPPELVREGVLALTRLGLIMRMTPSGGFSQRKDMRLKPSSISSHLYTYWPRITARAILRKANNPAMPGLFRCLTEADMQELCADKFTRINLERLNTFVARSVWSDLPPMPDVRQTTNPSQQPAVRLTQNKSEPFQSLPEIWLAEIGPRVLWVVQDMGPNLLRLLESLPLEIKSINWDQHGATIAKQFSLRVQDHLKNYPWLDRAGQPLSPAFPLITSNGKRGSDIYEWPPRNWEHVITLSVTLQAAHLFITLLSSAGRIGEIFTLERECVEVGRDGNSYLKGFTYKLSDSLFGDIRQWPAPDILRQCLGQQVRLAEAMDWLPKRLRDGLPQTPRFNNALWVSIGTSGAVGENNEVSSNQTLTLLAQRLNMDTKPGGRNIHAHRFRKTVGRLAGIALWNSPLVLKRLFGHKSIEMTLHYILSDSGVREEAEKVLRELRIMHCADALEEIHHTLRDGLPLPDNGGSGAARLVTAVREQDGKLRQEGRIWDEGSAYDLAYLLTAKGQGWRLIQENIVCSKTPGEGGLCQKKRSKGEPNTSNCKPECDSRIVLMRHRRDSKQAIEQYLDIARQARDDGQLLVLVGVMDNLREELENFSDLKERYLARHEVQSLLALCEAPETTEEKSV